MTAWQPTLVQLLRHGGTIGILRKGDLYLVARDSEPARDFPMTLDEVDFLDALDVLRYTHEASEAEEEQALGKVTEVVTEMLGLSVPVTDAQIDLVLNAQELLALPFEAVEAANGAGPLTIRDQPAVVITRRVRGAFEDHALRWPARPRVLFAAASPEDAVPAAEHEQPLRDALEPWLAPALDEAEVLTALEHASLDSIRDACVATEDKPYTHVHLLAHGCTVAKGRREKWGLKLHASQGGGAQAATADELVAVLSAGRSLPAVVTLTACDSGNLGSTSVAGASLAQALHVAGVPVVLGSQFPLTKTGSALVVESFYHALFAGDDVRDALHKARRAVHDRRDDTYYDWMSLVGYVQLPQGYADRLVDARLEAELASLRTAQALAEDLPNAQAYDAVAKRLRARIASLESWVRLSENVSRKAALDENRGLIGSAYKRLAELLFKRSQLGDDQERWSSESREALEEARRWYEAGFESNLSAHWLGVQALSLAAVLDGTIGNSWQWDAALFAAEAACAQNPDEYWACGSRAELHLLASYAGRGKRVADARRAIEDLKKRLGTADPWPLESTRRQLERYTSWWTAENGFFPEGQALAEDAAEVLHELGA
jgi:hypothetical protein